MLDYTEFFKLLDFLSTGNQEGIDPRLLVVANTEQINANNLFTNTIDIPAFVSTDYVNLRAFFIDWYAALKTFATVQKNISDVYSLPQKTIIDLFYSMGFDLGNTLRYMPQGNRETFFLSLVDLYKRKGTPLSIIEFLSFMGIPNVSLIEYWVKINSEGKMMFEGDHVISNSDDPLLINAKSSYSYSEVFHIDPHWFLTEDQAMGLMSTTAVRLPSKSPHFSLRFAFQQSKINALMSYLSRTAEDSYDAWEVNHNSLIRNIRSETGYDISYLELFVACNYCFIKQYGSAENSGQNYIYYNMDMTSYSAIELQYMNLVNVIKPGWNGFYPYELGGDPRLEREIGLATLTDQFTRNIAENRIAAYDGRLDTLLDRLWYPDSTEASPFRLEIDNYFLWNKADQIFTYLYNDLTSYLITNIGANAPQLGLYALDIKEINYLLDAIYFFKPYRARLLGFEKILDLGTRLEETIWVKDIVYAGDGLRIDDYDTGDGNWGVDATATVLTYIRDHYDQGSSYDLGACDDSILIQINQIRDDYVDEHKYNPDAIYDSTCTVANWITYDADGTERIWTCGGFTNFDCGWVFDRPHASDLIRIDHVTVVDIFAITDRFPTPESEVAGDTIIRVTFNQDVDAMSVDELTFFVEDDIIRLDGVRSVVGNTITFTAAAPFIAGHTIRVITTTGVMSTTGRTLSAPDMFTFSIVSAEYGDIHFWYDVGSPLSFPEDRESFYSVPKMTQSNTDMEDLYATDPSGVTYIKLSDENMTGVEDEINGLSLQGMDPEIITDIESGYPYTPNFNPRDALVGRLGYFIKKEEVPEPEDKFLLWWACDSEISWESLYTQGSGYRFISNPGEDDVYFIYGADSGIYRSDDMDYVFDNSPPDYTPFLSISSGWRSYRKILIGTENYLYYGTYSSYGAISWEKKISPDTPRPWNCVLAYGASPSYETILIAASNDPVELYISYNSGTTWSTILNTNTQSYSTIASDPEGHILVGTKELVGDHYEGSLYVSTDHGATWNKRLESTTRGFILASSDGNYGENMYICTESMNPEDDCIVYNSTDGGTTWNELLSGREWNFINQGYQSSAILLGSKSHGLWSYNERSEIINISSDSNIEWSEASVEFNDSGWSGYVWGLNKTTGFSEVYNFSQYDILKANTPEDTTNFVLDARDTNLSRLFAATDSGVFKGRNITTINSSKDHNPRNLTIYGDQPERPLFGNSIMQMCGNSCIKLRQLYTDSTSEEVGDVIMNEAFSVAGFSSGDLLRGRFGFYIYLEPSTGHTNPASLTFINTITLECIDIRFYATDIRVYRDVTLCGTISYDNPNIYSFMEFSFGLENNDWGFYINGVEQEISGKQSLEIPEGINILHGDIGTLPGHWLSLLIDNIIIHTDPTFSLYPFRGFDRYTPELPPPPTVPADDIIFWWTGMKDEYGLSRFDYYGGKDYLKLNDYVKTAGLVSSGFTYPYTPPKQYTSNDILNPNANASVVIDDITEDLHIALLYFGHSNTNLDLNRFRIGSYFKYSVESTFEYDVTLGGEGSYVSMGVKQSSYPGDKYVEVCVDGTFIHFDPYPFLIDTTYFIEVSYDRNLNIASYSIDGTPIQTISTSIEEVPVVSGMIMTWLTSSYDYPNIIYIGNIMISTNPTVNFYEKGYHLLTEYPKDEEWWYEKILTYK